MKVEENVAFPLRRHTELSDEQIRDRAHQLLARVDMQNERNKLPSEISGGMKKRVGLARALALDPTILLLDEPTAGLDPITAGEINGLIRELQKERKVSAILVTHDLHTVRTVSDRVALLYKGNILIEGTFEDLYRSKSPFVSDFLKRSF
jgi:phospholipid/cholesterol/gamma-HCH transport system ATP-binding protein